MYKRNNVIFEGPNVSYAAIAEFSTDKGQPLFADVVNKVESVCNNLLGCSITPEDISSANFMSAKLYRKQQQSTEGSCFTRRFQRD